MPCRPPWPRRSLRRQCGAQTLGRILRGAQLFLKMPKRRFPPNVVEARCDVIHLRLQRFRAVVVTLQDLLVALMLAVEGGVEGVKARLQLFGAATRPTLGV